MQSLEPPQTPLAIQRAVAKFADDELLMDILIANAPYMKRTRLCTLLGINETILIAISAQMSIPIHDVQADIPNQCIIHRLGHLVPDAIVKAWDNGLIVTYLSDTGQRITHHFASGGTHLFDAVQSSEIDSTVTGHLNARLWL